MAGTSITCCLCGEQFDERTLSGTWLDRRCPRCKGKLSEEVYDEAAADVIARHRPQLGRKGARRLERLALARYYTSEWFRLACAGQGSKAPDKGLFGLLPGYDPKNGAFRLVPADEDRSPEGGLGTSAEYAVFDALRKDVIRPESPLAGARLIPGLVFPWLPGQKPKQWGARHRAETDCVLICRSCAVIVEVKRRSHHVRVSRGQSIRERTESGSFRSAPEPLEQVGRGADSFAERQALFPPERIYKLVVFVEPHSFEGGRATFKDRLLVSHLDENGGAPFVEALRTLARSLDPIASAQEVDGLSAQMLERFGNTLERRAGSIVRGCRPAEGSRLRRTSALMRSIEALCQDVGSPLHGAHVLTNVVCEVQVGQRDAGRSRASKAGRDGGRKSQTKQVDVTGLLLTRTHAVFIDARRWPVHVNTHAPFATVYTGDPAEGAVAVADDIRHDWDLDAISYRNRSHSLTLANYVAKCMPELDRYRERNRVCTLHVFIDPASYFTDCETFRQKSFVGYWRGRDNNVIAALEALASGAEPVMTQKALDKFARSIAAIGN